ncbi:MAG TPA: ArsR family transcriptional regulator, partial [Gemmatimonadota bacterium]|nr:ArsR family transcriptional regulator [Gemmatimonadota bacterium]
MAERLPEGTKRGLLDLLVREERTAEQLAGSLGVSATAVRQHLATLAGLGLVERRKSGSRSGRPAFLYRLSELGRRAYPKRHDMLARQLIDTLLAREGEEWTLKVVREAARAVAGNAADRFGGDREERWQAALEWLEDELAWEAQLEDLPGGGRRVVLHQCPFRAVSLEHPEVCGTFLAALLELLTGDGPFVHCPIGDGVRCCALVEHRSQDGALPEEAA